MTFESYSFTIDEPFNRSSGNMPRPFTPQWAKWRACTLATNAAIRATSWTIFLNTLLLDILAWTYCSKMKNWWRKSEKL